MMPMRARRQAAPAHAKPISLPAPTGGINAISPAMGMPVSDCFYLWNMLPSEYGLRARLGSLEHVSGLTGTADNYVRSVLSFAGPESGGGSNRLFGVTSTGIFNCTTSGAVGAAVHTFSTHTGRAGHGVAHSVVTAAGLHYLAYFDEVNGMLVYDENAGTWGAGSVTGVNPANLVFGTVFKGRLWMAEKDTANLWYLDAGAIAGAATQFSLGFKAKNGGDIRGMWSWTIDGGAGVDDRLVVLTSGGDVIIFHGTDPDDSALFGMVGAWSLGALPDGREIASDFGGDMLILARQGLVPLSRLVAGQSLDSSQYATAKITNLFNAAMISKADEDGWSLRISPEDNALIVNVPDSEGVAGTQLAMSLGNKGWGRYRDLEMYSSASFGGKLYFGDPNGSVWVNTGYVDGVTLADPTGYTAVQYAGLTAFQNFGSARQKQIQLIRPYFVGEASQPEYSVAARYDFDQAELSTVVFTGSGGSGWDSGLWDTAIWSGEYSPTHEVRGAAGIGVNMAISWRGATTGRCILTGFDVAYTEGGYL